MKKRTRKKRQPICITGLTEMQRALKRFEETIPQLIADACRAKLTQMLQEPRPHNARNTADRV